jgi:MFS family permease
MIAIGMWVQAGGIGLFVLADSLIARLSGSALLGIGTALVYPTLLAAVSDVAHPEWRASAIGVYRLWRDGGYAVGAMLAGLLADAGDAAGIAGIPFAMLVIAALTLVSGMVVAIVMYETLPARRAALPVAEPERLEPGKL